jgi:predicted hydrocarbon binding protein
MGEAELVNKAFRVILVAVEDVVGKRGVESLLRQAGLSQYINNFPPSNNELGGHRLVYMSQINRALFDVYGKRGARAILMRTGKSRAQDGIAENGMVANATKIAAKFLPRRTKVKLTLDTAAKEYSEQLGTHVKIEEDGEFFYWTDPQCGNCIDWQNDQPVCYTTVGFIHGLVAWILEDDNFKVEEIACRAKGDAACKYRITLSSQ